VEAHCDGRPDRCSSSTSIYHWPMVGSKDASMPEMAGASLAPIASNGQVKLLLSRDRRQSFERRERDIVIASSSAVTMTCDSELGARSLLGSIGRARRRWRPNQIQSLAIRRSQRGRLNPLSLQGPASIAKTALFQKHSDSVDFPVEVADLFAVLHTAPAADAHCRLTICLVKRACCCSFMYL
jgi:hypothetical protein